ncbi:hypothetical protein K6U20_12960 [Vibrio fluvialis]|uniref:hypothetical protein n=1 Tax=Vibrio fluvialis TaxID=676 RepID=UPI001EEABE98|nr:hypothetical protein [Vibrio fluvialis]MCG6405529.1 hypothetical protein [Vibrio fluvialis]
MSGNKLKKEIDLLNIFKLLNEQRYCLIKIPPEFPGFNIGSDLDIFCYDIREVSRVILGELNKLINDMEYHIGIEEKNEQVHIDFKCDDKIILRFDLYSSLPNYNNIKIKDSYFVHVLENIKLVDINNVQVKTPSSIDDSIIRYIEYQEFYAQRPDKIKHIEYIEKKLAKNEVKLDEVFEKLHYFTSLPNVYEERKVSSNNMIRYFVTNGKKAYRYTKLYGLSATFKKIFGKMKR